VVNVSLEAHTITFEPTSATQSSVRAELLKLTAESTESRAQVIEALIKVAKEKPVKVELPFDTDYKWTIAVNLLAELRAIEAINVLVENLDKTGEINVISTIHYRPVSTALEAIGEPAVPRLIEALSDNNPKIQLHAASTLAGIGKPAFIKLIEALHSSNINTRGGAALAIGWIGGKKARIAIEKAMARETNEEVLKNLQYAWEQSKKD
jgi:HEAT repeat protein